MRRKRKAMSANRHLHNILGGLRRRGMPKADRDAVKLWLETPGLQHACVYCEAKLKPHTYSLDHKTPLVHGGANTCENLAICCKRCNCAKGSLLEQDYEGLLQGLKALTEAGQKNVLARLRAAGKWYRR